VGLEGRPRQADVADERSDARGLDRPQAEPVRLEVGLVAVDVGVGRAAVGDRGVVLHHDRVGAHLGERITVALAPAAHQEPLRV
jgi:hypothetical protein